MGSRGTHPQRSYRKRRCRRVQLCEGCRAINWSSVLDTTPPYFRWWLLAKLTPNMTARRWWLLAKLTPNMTARLMGRGCHGFECGASSGTSCQPRFNLLLYSAAPLSTLRTHVMVFGDRFDDRVQEVAWPDSVVRLEFVVRCCLRTGD